MFTKKFIWYSIIIFISFSLGLVAKGIADRNPNNTFSNLIDEKIIPTPLVKYEIESLQQSAFDNGTFEIKEILSEEEAYTAYLFEYNHFPDLDNDNPKMTTGQINIPTIELLENDELRTKIQSDGFPVILMLRGFVSQEIYKTGIGTRNSAAYFATNGFITIAPDFLGYAGSDENSANIFESRFQTYVTAISLIKTIEQVSINPHTIPISDSPNSSTSLPNKLNDQSSVFIWAHSNGGQIALTLLEVTKGNYPTTLWAPVTKGFPYAVLYYTDESADKGKFIRRELANFEAIYEADNFSIESYLNDVNAPLILHQGTGDDAIPLDWTNSFVSRMRRLDKDTTYHTYSGADHNMRPNWNEVVKRDLEFFNSFLFNGETN